MDGRGVTPTTRLMIHPTVKDFAALAQVGRRLIRIEVGVGMVVKMKLHIV